MLAATLARMLAATLAATHVATLAATRAATLAATPSAALPATLTAISYACSDTTLAATPRLQPRTAPVQALPLAS